MSTEELEKLRFPIGRAPSKPELTAAERRDCVDRIAALPAKLRDVVAKMDGAALDTPYRPGGWTARQVLHHLPDSHMNAYVRFKMAATETDPPIRAYLEDEWAKLPDSAGPVDVSLTLIDALHTRWSGWLRAFDEATWRRAYLHPKNGRVTLEQAVQLYAWHGDHHLAHVRAAAAASGRV